jgi:hypothetical protein
MRKLWVSFLSMISLLVSLSAVAMAKPAFSKVPGSKGKKPLVMRTVSYNGGTNGRMVIEVKNDGKTAQRFEAGGIYFVPGGDPEKAPQRLGAAGPFEIVTDGAPSGEAIESIEVPAGKTVQLELHVFCIDSHRSSPSSETKFSAAKDRMPKQLRDKIQDGTKEIMKKHKNAAPAATGEIQSHVWSTRDADWIELQGERKGEAKLKDQPRQSPRHDEQRQEQRRR